MARSENQTSEVAVIALVATRPSLAFEQLASFVAIRQTQRPDEVLRQALLQLVTTEPAGSFNVVGDFVRKLASTYGLRLTDTSVQPALDGLLSSREILRDPSGSLAASSETRTRVLQRTEDARDLEKRVREGWAAQLAESHPEVSSDSAWRALEAYLSRAFKQHGLLTMSLLDPSVAVPQEYQVGLRAMLSDALRLNCEQSQHDAVGEAISLFLTSAGADARRSAFIATLADCTVSYYSLTVPPSVAEELRKKLKPLAIFLDTNVLFGLVDLDDRPVVHVSHELVELVQTEDLPFRLRYHEETGAELKRTLDGAVSRLTGVAWSPGISRAAAKSPRVTTIARLYHERNSESPITAESFFRPFAHLDVLVQERGIKLYRDGGRNDQQHVYDLIADYQDFLKKAKREKPYEAVKHDMILLDCVRRMRSKAKSSLEAEALCVTTDYLLWRFDRLESKRRGGLPSMILPNQLLQLLRPFVSITPNFDRSFAEAFAIPEFRALAHRGSAATNRLLEIIATHGRVSERVASSLLANDLFLDGLAEKSEVEVYQFVESAIAAENDMLGRERDELLKALTEAQARAIAAESLAAENALAETERVRAQMLEASENTRRAIDERREREVSEKTALVAQAEERAAREGKRAESEREAADFQRNRALKAEEELAGQQRALVEAEEKRQKTDAGRRMRNRAVLGVAIGCVVAASLEFVWWKSNFQWLLDHPNGYGIRGCIACAAIALTLVMFRRDWWKGCVLGVALPGLFVALQIVGGRRAVPTTDSLRPSTSLPSGSSKKP